MRWKEFLIGLGTAGTGVLLWLVLIPWQIPALAAHADEISPALFPRLLAWLLILLGVVHMAEGVQYRPRGWE